jgi:hypothetical protein
MPNCIPYSASASARSSSPTQSAPIWQLARSSAVRGEDERDVEPLGVVETLLHAGSNGVLVVLRLDDGDRTVRRVEEEVVSAALLAKGDHLSPDDHLAVGEAELPAPLVRRPSVVLDHRRAEPIADV